MMLFLTFWLGLAAVTGLVARSRGRDFLPWFLYGLVIALVALPHALLLAPTAEAAARRERAAGRGQCPDCRSWIDRAASVCPQCRRALDPGWSSADAAAAAPRRPPWEDAGRPVKQDGPAPHDRPAPPGGGLPPV